MLKEVKLHQEMSDNWEVVHPEIMFKVGIARTNYHLLISIEDFEWNENEKIYSTFVFLADLLKELGQVVLLEFEEFNFLITFLGLNLLSFSIFLFNSLDLGFKFTNFILKFCFLVFKLLDSFFEISFSMLGLELLSHGKCYRALIKCLIRSDCHFDFISDSQKKKTSFWLTKSYLSDNFIEALRKEFFSYWANTTFSGLSFHEFLIEHLSESCNVHSWSWLMTNILNEVFTIFNPLSWGKNSIENILTAWFCVHWW